jgi:hypothetical protein
MDNTVNLGLCAAHKIVSEYAERTYAYIEKTQRYTKHEHFFRSFISILDGCIVPSTISRYFPFKSSLTHLMEKSNRRFFYVHTVK